MSRVIFIEGGGVKVDFLGYYEIDEDGTSKSFTGVDLGASSSGMVVFGVGTVGTSGSIGSVSLNSNALSAIVEQGGSSRVAGLFPAIGASGTGTVTVTTANQTNRWRLAVWKLRNLRSTTAHDTGSGTDAANAYSLDLSLDVLRGGAAIGFVQMDGNGSTGPTWTGLAEDYSSPSSSSRHGGAHIVSDATGTLTITADGNAAGGARGVSASFR